MDEGSSEVAKNGIGTADKVRTSGHKLANAIFGARVLESCTTYMGQGVAMTCGLTITNLRTVINFIQAHPWLYTIFAIVLVWLHPDMALQVLKYCMVGMFGHLVLGLGSLRWFKQYRHETVPLIKFFGYELTVRNDNDYKSATMEMIFLNAFTFLKGLFNQGWQVHSPGARAPQKQASLTNTGPTHGSHLALVDRAKDKHQARVPVHGSYLVPIVVKGPDSATLRLRPASHVLVQGVGILFIYRGLLDTIEHRQLILHIQITKFLLDRTDNLTRGLMSLLSDLMLPHSIAAPFTHARIVDKPQSQTLAKQVRRLLYKPNDRKHWGHAWWHDHDLPPIVTIKEIEELSTWVKVCLNMLITSKRAKLHSVMDAANEELLNKSLKQGLSLNRPRTRAERMKDAPKMPKMDIAKATEERLPVKQAVDGVKYSGVAGDLIGLGQDGVLQPIIT